MPAIQHQNILILLFDTLSGTNNAVSAECNEHPALSQVIKNSVNFTRCYTPNPESSPARASLFTGLDPSVHGLWTNGVSLPSEEKTFIGHLADCGYRTYHAGKVQLAGVSRWTTEALRASEYSDIQWANGPLHRSRQNAYLLWLQKVAPDHYANLFPHQANPDSTLIDSTMRAVLSAVPGEFSFNHWVATQLVEMIADTPSNKPFIAVAGFCVGDNFGTEPVQAYDGERTNSLSLQQADEAIACLFKYLEDNHLKQDTAIVLVSARGHTDFNELDGVDCMMRESSIRVPLSIQQTDVYPASVDTLVSLIDVAPTILDMANVDTKPRLQGRSLIAPTQPNHSALGWALSRLRSDESSDSGNWRTAYCNGSMKLVVRHGAIGETHAACALYNLVDDPQEIQNLASDPKYANELECMIDQMIDARCAFEDRTEPRIAEF